MNKKMVATIVSIILGLGALWALANLGTLWGILLGAGALGVMKLLGAIAKPELE